MSKFSFSIQAETRRWLSIRNSIISHLSANYEYCSQANENFWEMELLVSMCIVLFATLSDVCGEPYSYKTVQTHHGAIRGVQKYTLFRNVSYYSFVGVPYAEKPIGNLRFKVQLPLIYQLRDFHRIPTVSILIKIIHSIAQISACVFDYRHRYRSNHGNQICSMHFDMEILASNNHLPLEIGAHNLKIVYI